MARRKAERSTLVPAELAWFAGSTPQEFQAWKQARRRFHGEHPSAWSDPLARLLEEADERARIYPHRTRPWREISRRRGGA